VVVDRGLRVLEINSLEIVGGSLGAGRRKGCENWKGRWVCGMDLIVEYYVL